MKTQMGCIKSGVLAGAVITMILSLSISTQVAAQGPVSEKSVKAGSENVAPKAALNKELQTIRKATKRYQDVNVALKDGYLRDPMNLCEKGSMMGMPDHVGAMGIHYFRPDLLGLTGDKPRVNGTGTHTDFRKPSILIYEPQADGSMELVAVENLVFSEAWHKKHGNKMPEFMGYEYFTMIDNPRTKADEAHMFEPHYDLHIWLFRDNPNGLFTPFNPNVTCENHKADTQQDQKMNPRKSEHKMNKNNH